MKVRLNYESNLKFKATVRDFEDFVLDEPESFHGNNLGPSPIEYFLIGIGGCLGSTFTYCFQKKGIALESLDIEINGRIKHIPPHLNLRLTEIEVEFNYSVKNDPSDEKINYCITEFKKHCPIYDPLAKGFPIKINFKRRKKN